jgi:hypothetical protein
MMIGYSASSISICNNAPSTGSPHAIELIHELNSQLQPTRNGIETPSVQLGVGNKGDDSLWHDPFGLYAAG